MTTRTVQNLAAGVLLMAAAGCVSVHENFTSGICVPVRTRSVELAAEQLSTFVGATEAPTPAGLSYRSVVLPPELAEAMVRAALADTGPLMDETRDQCFWPASADTWSYSRASAEPPLLGGGSGTGGVGVRPAGDRVRTAITYSVRHDVSSVHPIDTTITFDGTVSPSQTVVFYAPLVREDGRRTIHAILFTFGAPRRT